MAGILEYLRASSLCVTTMHDFHSLAARSTRRLAGLCLAISLTLAARQAAAEERTPRFEQDVAPILKTYCWKCHGGEGRVAGLDARTLPLLLKGGQSGSAVTRGASDKSLLYQKLAAHKMPPDGALQPTDEHIALIRQWLDGGAPADYETDEPTSAAAPGEAERSFWAFRPPVRSPIPAVPDASRAQTPIDAFLLAKLQPAGLDFAPPASRRTLVRRAYLDVIGLPPSPEEVAEFLADPAQDELAFGNLVERLLASPHFGERFGRHWLDAAGYVDVIATDNDATIMEEREGIWKYRDWVVRAINSDKPYDRFLIEQLCGDELIDWRNAPHLTAEMQDLLIATGFLRQAADVTYAPELNTADIRHQVLYDTLQIVGANLLGLTLHCCQCHDHKFDPLSHQDYFRIAAVFAPAYDAQNWKQSKERTLFDVSSSDRQAIDEHNGRLDQKLVELRQQEAQTRQPFVERVLERKLAAIPEALRADLRVAVGSPADKRDDVQKYLAEKLGGSIAVSDAEAQGLMDDPQRAALAALRRRMAALPAEKKSYGKIQALWDVGRPPPSYLFRRGDFATPGEPVQAGRLSVLCAPGEPVQFRPPAADSPTSGYRTAFALWLTRPEHPLTARVIVNRVWQQYFGRGIVATPDNFGSSGARPTHPELLDDLAVELVAHSWSLKWLHRQILNSAAYQQQSRPGPPSSAAAADPRAIDPENKLLWHMPPRRLESEIVRDSLLSVSGLLDPTPGGPPVPLKANPDGSVEIDAAKCSTPTSRFRRSLYVFCRRNYQLSELSVFDQPTVAYNCTVRSSSAVVLQSLSMLNGRFALETAERLAERVRALAGEAEAARIAAVFQLALSRPPTAEEQSLCAAHLARQTQRYQAEQKPPQDAAASALVDLCQMLLNTNEFLYRE